MEKNSGTPTYKLKRALSLETLVFILVLALIFGSLGYIMEPAKMISTLMNTAYSLLMDTVFYIMAISVLAGAISGLLSEFGIIAAINKILSPLMRPLYGMPGASIVGVITTYLSDNPAILTLADDNNFKRYFKKYQIPALTNIGTAFGMGLIITTYMIGISSPKGENFALPALIGNIGAIIGSIVSTRIMLVYTSKEYGVTEPACHIDDQDEIGLDYRVVRPGNIPSRLMSALLDGGKNGVDMGLAVIPGVLIICSFVMMLTNGPSVDGTYTGAAYEGVGFLPFLADKLGFILYPLFGFSSPEGIAVPITSLGAAGAAIGIIPRMVQNGLAGSADIAVFTAMCMCWSGYLSTHVAMMDTLGHSNLTGKAIISHTIGGLVAGISANFIYKLIMLIMSLF